MGEGGGFNRVGRLRVFVCDAIPELLRNGADDFFHLFRESPLSPQEVE